mgnify:CR=1 FL=1
MIIIALTLFLSLGIACGYYFQPEPVYIYLSTALSLTTFLFTYRQSNRNFIQKPYFTVSTWLLAFVIGLLCFSLHYAPNRQSHYTHHINKENTAIQGTISERLKPNDYSQKYVLKIESVNNIPATGRILVTLPQRKQLQIGDVIVFSNDLTPITKPLNPYQFDYSDYMAKQNIFHQIRLENNYIITDQDKNTDYYIEKLRSNLISSFEIHAYTPETTSVLKALLFGQRQDMDKEISANYTDAGVIHILAISGLHIAILFYILNLIIKPLKRLGNGGRLTHLIFILVFLWLFALLSGLSASVVRSVVMFSFIAIGAYFNRSAPTYHSVAVSALFLLLINPNFLFDAGFQLSYLSVFSIVVVYPLFKDFKISEYKAVNYMVDVALLSLIAQIGVLPLSLYYFNQFPLLFLLANIVVVPLSTIILVMALVVLILNFIYPDAALLFGRLLEILTQSMNGFISWVASFEDFIIKDIPFTQTLNIALYGVIGCFIIWLYKKSYKHTVALLCSVLLFQSMYIITQWNAKDSQELIVFNTRKSTLITIKNNDEIMALSNDASIKNHNTLKAYQKENFNTKLTAASIQNTLWFKGKKY